MIRILIGFLIGIVLTLVAAFCYVRYGFVDPRADIEVGSFESKLAMPALDAAIDRRATDDKNPLQPTDENLMAGMNIYQQNCSGCHGDIQHPHQAFGASFYPRAPQFLEDAADMPENQNFYIIKHGIRLSGMPAWGPALDDQKIWRLTAFLSHMDKLPPPVSAAWKTAASTPEVGSASNPSSAPETKPTDKRTH